MSLVFTFLYVTSQAKVLTLDEALDFHKNLARKKETRSDILDKATEKDFNKNKLEDNNDQALASEIVEDKCTRVREELSFQGPQSPSLWAYNRN